MPYHEQGLIDILEIYHARQLRDQLVQNLHRLRQNRAMDLYGNPERRRETGSYYEAMLLTTAELLRTLGDDSPFG